MDVVATGEVELKFMTVKCEVTAGRILLKNVEPCGSLGARANFENLARSVLGYREGVWVVGIDKG